MRTGHRWPLGAHWDGQGVNFAVFSAHAQRVEVCLFDAGGQQEQQPIALPARSHDVWHGYLPGAAPGLVYGLRAHALQLGACIPCRALSPSAFASAA